MSSKTTYRREDWFDSEENRVLFGIDVKQGEEWKHCAENGRPLLYVLLIDRETKLKALRAKASRDWKKSNRAAMEKEAAKSMRIPAAAKGAQ